MRDLASFNQTERQTELVKLASDTYSQLQNHTAARSGLGNALGSLIANLTMVGALLLAIPLVRSGQLDGVMLAAVALGIQSSFEAVLPMTTIHHYQQEAYAAGQRLFAIADAKPPVSFDFSREIFLPPDSFSLSVRNLRFRYQENSPWVLDDVSFDLPAGGRLAIVGPSGAGKSSLAQVLLRLGEYSAGQILLGGTDLRHIHPEALRRNCGILLQNDHLFNATLAENLRLANPTASDEELLSAINKAGLDSILATLPDGLDTWIGENGSALSGGERRRVSIARILLKNSPLLILDEPTAGLDSITERQIMASINSLMLGKSTILITHRLTGLDSMDEILVLDQGKIAERGRLDDLISAKGLFYTMWRLQNDLIPEN